MIRVIFKATFLMLFLSFLFWLSLLSYLFLQAFLLTICFLIVCWLTIFIRKKNALFIKLILSLLIFLSIFLTSFWAILRYILLTTKELSVLHFSFIKLRENYQQIQEQELLN